MIYINMQKLEEKIVEKPKSVALAYLQVTRGMTSDQMIEHFLEHGEALIGYRPFEPVMAKRFKLDKYLSDSLPNLYGAPPKDTLCEDCGAKMDLDLEGAELVCPRCGTVARDLGSDQGYNETVTKSREVIYSRAKVFQKYLFGLEQRVSALGKLDLLGTVELEALMVAFMGLETAWERDHRSGKRTQFPSYESVCRVLVEQLGFTELLVCI